MAKKVIQSLKDIERFYIQGQHVSINHPSRMGLSESTSAEDNIFLSDEGVQVEKSLGELYGEDMLKCLTKKQRKMVEAMLAEKKRRKAAMRLGVTLQAVNQMILRVRERVEIYQAVSK